MKVLFLGLFLVIGIVIVGFFVFGPKPDSKVFSSATTDYSKEITDKVKTETNNAVTQTKNSLFTAAKNAVDNMNPNNGSVKIDVVPNNNSISPPEVTTINFSSNQNVELNLKKNQKYFLKFQNLPANFCLYVNSAQVVVDNSNLVELVFANSGHYPLKTDFCNPTAKTLGQVIVE